MTPKKRRTRDVPRERYSTYLKRAGQFLNAMNASAALRDWDAAALNAVHCAISAVDALLVFKVGVRSAGESHQDAAALLAQHYGDEDISGKARSLGKILSYKNLAAYEDREITEAEARELTKLAQRFYDWVKSRLKT